MGPRWKLFSHIWFKSETFEHNVRLFVEEGHDFFLTDASGQGALVMSAGGYLLGAPGTKIDPGDAVEIFGFTDQVVEARAPLGSSTPRGEPIALALRSGDELPILLRPVGAGARPPERPGDQSHQAGD